MSRKAKRAAAPSRRDECGALPEPKEAEKKGAAAEVPTTPKKRRLRIPKLKADEGVANLHAEDKAFITEELALREEHGWSQDELAQRAGVKRSTVQHMEHHRRGLSLHVASVIAKAFGHTVDFFVQEGQKKILPLLGGGFYLELPLFA